MSISRIYITISIPICRRLLDLLYKLISMGLTNFYFEWRKRKDMHYIFLFQGSKLHRKNIKLVLYMFIENILVYV